MSIYFLAAQTIIPMIIASTTIPKTARHTFFFLALFWNYIKSKLNEIKSKGKLKYNVHKSKYTVRQFIPCKFLLVSTDLLHHEHLLLRGQRLLRWSWLCHLARVPSLLNLWILCSRLQYPPITSSSYRITNISQKCKKQFHLQFYIIAKDSIYL